MSGYSTGGGEGAGSGTLQDTLDALTDGFYVAAPDGTLVCWNDTLRSVAGMGDPEESSVTSLFGSDAGRAVETAVENCRPVVDEGPVVTDDGDRLPYELSVVPTSADDGERLVVGVVRNRSAREGGGGERSASAVDLERLHAASNRLYASESTSACLEAAIDAAVDVLGFDWCTMAAPTADGEALEVRAISEGAPLEEGDRPLRVDEGIAGQVYGTGESRVVGDLRETGAPVRDDLRAAVTVPVGDWGIFQAVTTRVDAFDDRDRQLAELLMTAAASALERIEREQQLRAQKAALERQNERLERFTGVVSHDLRSPLNFLRGTLRHAEATGDPERFQHCFDAIERMDRLIEDLLALAAEGAVIDDTEPVRLASVARRCWHTVETGDAQLRVDDATIRADEGRLQQLLENLLSNAVEHGGEDVTVTVEALESGFAVEDDGPGIPASERDRVFETGYTTGSGTGLGLTIVAEVADAHGWTVAVTDGDDGGARFEIRHVDRLA